MEKLTDPKSYSQHEVGFTLVEMLFVLAIVSILLLLSLPLHTNSIEKVETDQFLELLEVDMLTNQNLRTTTRDNIRIRFYDDYYALIHGANTVVTRRFPPNTKINTYGKDIFSFNKNGTFIDPRTVNITLNKQEYNLVFPLGKGRFYISEK